MEFDHFKRVNATDRHAAGDAVIRDVAAAIQASATAPDRADQALDEAKRTGRDRSACWIRWG